MKYELKVEDNSTDRIDKYLSKKLDFSRSQIKKLIKEESIYVNGQAIKSSYKVEQDDLIAFDYIEEEIELIPEYIPLDIVFEDEHILVINKQKDLVIHPSENQQSNTLVNGLIYKYKNLGNMDSIRPGIVHRLDKDTTGLLVIAKNDEAYKDLVEQFSEDTVEKKYMALVHGNLENNIKIDEPIGRNEKNRLKFAVNYKNGKEAITIVNPIKKYHKYTLIDLNLITGRTHQIRVHLSHINHPIVGDLTYGFKNEFNQKTQLLHAYELKFKHPITKEFVEFKIELPKEFEDVLRRIENYEEDSK